MARYSVYIILFSFGVPYTSPFIPSLAMIMISRQARNAFSLGRKIGQNEPLGKNQSARAGIRNKTKMERALHGFESLPLDSVFKELKNSNLSSFLINNAANYVPNISGRNCDSSVLFCTEKRTVDNQMIHLFTSQYAILHLGQIRTSDWRGI